MDASRACDRPMPYPLGHRTSYTLALICIQIFLDLAIWHPPELYKHPARTVPSAPPFTTGTEAEPGAYGPGRTQSHSLWATARMHWATGPLQAWP